MKRHSTSLSRRQSRLGYLFVLPFIVGLVLFVAVPFGRSVYFSFCELSITESGYSLVNVGLENYRRIFLVDPNFRQYIYYALRDMAINVPVSVIFAFFVASLLNTEFHGRAFARMVLFLPLIVSSGLVMDLLSGYTMQTLMSATSQNNSAGLSTAMVKLMNDMGIEASLTGFVAGLVERISDIMNMAAVPIIIFLAGLQSISPSLYEASYVEGATKWEVFWKISLPMVSPLILVCVVYSVIDSFTNVHNRVISIVHATNFERIKFGEGSAMAFSYMIIMGIILAIVCAVISRFVFYQDDRRESK